jgi:hypothetical protein
LVEYQPHPPLGGKTKGDTDMPKAKIARSQKANKPKVSGQIQLEVKMIKDMFKKKEIHRIAKETQFVQRQRKLDAYEFFLSLSFGTLKGDVVTLSALAENLSCAMTRVGLHERFNQRTCDFLQGVYDHIYKVISSTQNFSMNNHLFNKFKHIQILDSTSWKIPKALAAPFAGYNLAGCKTQCLLDYKTGHIQLLDILPQNHTDHQYSKTLDHFLQADDLCIFDLGYAIPETLSKIDHKGAFFMCRFNAIAMSLYLKKHSSFVKVNVLDVLTKLETPETIHEIPCYVGNPNKKTKVRLLAIRAPQEVANRRRQKLRKNALKKHRNSPTEQSLQLCNWTLFIANIPVEKGLSVREIISLYPIRWTIEIFFKQLKSILKIHKTEVKNNPHRLKAEVLARYIVAVFVAYCYSVARSYTWRKRKREISFEKTVKYFKRNIATLLDHLLTSTPRAIIHLQQMILKVIHTCQKYRQLNRKNSLDILIEQSIFKNLKHIKFSLAHIVDLLGLT